LLPYELRVLKSLGYAVFEGEAYDLNFLGIRGLGRDQTASPQDDQFLMIYKNEQGFWQTEHWSGTTDPTSYYLGTPINVDGTAILCEGQHRGMWSLGLHRGVPALVQVGVVKVYRDKDRDTILDMDPKTVDTGLFGINFHGGTGSRASAGCQVTPTWSPVARARQLLELQTKHGHGSTLSYTLVRREQLYFK
jgi:hypothetical protein